MLRLNELVSVIKKRKRVGRGGDKGGQSGRGHKGQGSRSGGKIEIKAFFEGGQMPLSRRLPCRGFTNPFRKIFETISLQKLENSFSDGDVVTKEALFQKKILKGKKRRLVKILGNGTLSKKLTVIVDAFTKSAKQAICNSGGKVQVCKKEGSDSSIS